MTTSEPKQAFVWVWLPESAEPVIAGRLDDEGEIVTFTYGRSYLDRPNRIPIYLPELPLDSGRLRPLVGNVAGCIQDAAPDSWGRRVILNRHFGASEADAGDLNILTYLLESGSDRIGALDFQTSGSTYVPRGLGGATLQELMDSAERVEQGLPLSVALDQALLHGSSIGGARPKAILSEGSRGLIAKFSSTSDPYPVVKGEFAAMELAHRVGINAAPVSIRQVLGKDVLLVERFDRTPDGHRRLMVSSLTILGLSTLDTRYASYANLAAEIRKRFTSPGPTLRELFARITFNILTGNTDDHPRNHAAFWDGSTLTLTPAYDICPQPRAGGLQTQIMAIGQNGFRASQVAGCVEHAFTYHLTEHEARGIVDRQIDAINTQWNEVCDLAKMTPFERDYFWHRQFLNPYALEDYP